MIKNFLTICVAVLLQLALSSPAAAVPDSNELSAIVGLTAALDQKYAPGSITTGTTADVALKEATAAQQRLQSWYEQAEKACHNKFFVNDCLDDTKQQRRQYIVVLQRISLEAKALQRKLHIEQLDQELLQKQAKP
ncbi:hypothetical protein H8L32_01860 [Undibacterium sp. CY18W]|uniref:Lysozyme inhibitor LprI N-terminal domain-containing protein n=1 Tax=Undibacterium hunanense TaxID=2762292 RepID=A0ABR6ZK03_9BURK|nr:hypothetical protein [Undibacterium hunanense]MBC3916220.1 hypothetical protein [Undibacterium hunanense]